MATTQVEPLVREKPARVEYAFLDGIRGFAALAVVLYHAYHLIAKLHPAVPKIGTHSPFFTGSLFLKLFGWLDNGALAVPVFILLSGFCLMLPVVRSRDRSVPGGVGAYLKRRARRILPPYYVALVLSLFGYGALGLLHHLKPHFHVSAPPITQGQLLSHIFLVENMSTNWRYTIDGPMWSVATEWQIYFLFPLILLPVWRKWGKLAAVIVGFAFGEIPTLMFKNFCWTFPFYLGLFALGMTAAVILLSEDPRDVALRERTPWGLVSAMFGAGFIAWIVFKPHMFIGDWQIDPYVAVGAACFIIYCARKIDRAERKSFVLRIFESKAALKLGAFSYSVYLVHHPIVVVLSQLVLKHHWSPIRSLLTLVVLGVPFVLVLAYGFHVLFERPFQTSRSRKRLNAEAAFAAVSSGAEA